jgi:hypothetical protein
MTYPLFRTLGARDDGRARRASGQDPDEAAVRPATVVEGYKQ